MFADRVQRLTAWQVTMIVKRALRERGLGRNKIHSSTVDFEDLVRRDAVFVYFDDPGWCQYSLEDRRFLLELAQRNGFYLDTRICFDID